MKRHRAKLLCCLRYGGACCGGMVFGIGVLLICLFAFHVIGCSTSDPPCSYMMGDLTQPTLTSSYNSVKIWMQPSSAAASAGVTHFVVQSKRASTSWVSALHSARRRLDDSVSLDSLPRCGEDIGWDFVGLAPYSSEGTSVEVTGLDPDSSWVFRYKFRVEDGRLSTPSIAVVGGTKALSVPSSPSLSALSSSVSSVSVKWPPVEFPANGGSDVSGYEVQWAEGDIHCNCREEDWNEGAVLGAETASWTKGGLQPNQTVSLRVRALNKVGEGEFSQPYSFRADQEGAAAPGGVPSFSVEQVSWNQIGLSWEPAADNGAQILRYEIEISSPSSSLRALGGAEVRDADGKDTGFVWTGLVQSTEYEFAISAVNSKGTSQKSSLKVSTSNACRPARVPLVYAKLYFSDGIALGWREPNPEACFLPTTDYEVLVRETGQTLRTQNLYADVYDPPLDADTEYTFEVTALNEDGPSEVSVQKLKTYASGGCTQRTDVRWCAASDQPFYDNSRLTDELASCAKSTLGSGSASEKCISNNLVGNPSNSPFPDMHPMSSTCLTCFGQSVECNKRKCTGACQLGQDIAGAECIECVNTHCKADTYSCMGMGADQSPPDPVRNP